MRAYNPYAFVTLQDRVLSKIETWYEYEYHLCLTELRFPQEINSIG